MLDKQTFKTVIKNAPLISLDICMVCNSQILLCKRNNEPLKGTWFTPGGRIHKNENWKNALERIAKSEIGLNKVTIEDYNLMGIWDHIYRNSVVNQNISTHYVNLPHFVEFKSRPKIVLDDQHNEYDWFDLLLVSTDESFHPYMQKYAGWILNRVYNIRN